MSQSQNTEFIKLPPAYWHGSGCYHWCNCVFYWIPFLSLLKNETRTQLKRGIIMFSTILWPGAEQFFPLDMDLCLLQIGYRYLKKSKIEAIVHTG